MDPTRDTVVPTPAGAIDDRLEELRRGAPDWVALPIRRRIELLRRVHMLAGIHAERWAEASIAGKHIRKGSPLEGEEWISGPYPVLTWIDECVAVLRALEAGEDPLHGLDLRITSAGTTSLRVYPTNLVERLLLHGYVVDVEMEHGVTPSSLGESIAVALRQPPHDGRVCLVLGAGNISSIPPLDVLYRLIAHLDVVVVKLNPVNSYLGPVFEDVFAPLVDAGYVRFVYGGGDVGSRLAHHPDVGAVHITGSARTHDAIVFGSGDDGARRKRENRPLLDKPISSELGGVGPTIVVPGPWSDADIGYQAEHIVSQKLHNSGFNCVASQVLVLPEGWEHGQALLDAIAHAMHEVEDRVPYYPGTVERQRSVSEPEDVDAVHVGVDGRRTIVLDVDHRDENHRCFREEFFAPVLATTTLPLSDPAAFLAGAVDFVNDHLHGSLGANVIIHPDTERALGAGFDEAVRRLDYGTVAINTWTGVAYLVTRAAWGAAPGHALDDVGSGIGVVHNSLLLDRTARTIVRAPFHPFPRGMRHGSFWLSPRPPWFVTNRTAATTTRLLTRWAASRSPRHLPGIVVSALRG